MTRATDDRIARLLQLDPSETGSGFDVPDHARAVQHFDTPETIRTARLDAWARIALACTAVALVFAIVAIGLPVIKHQIAHPAMIQQ